MLLKIASCGGGEGEIRGVCSHGAIMTSSPDSRRGCIQGGRLGTNKGHTHQVIPGTYESCPDYYRVRGESCPDYYQGLRSQAQEVYVEVDSTKSDQLGRHRRGNGSLPAGERRCRMPQAPRTEPRCLPVSGQGVQSTSCSVSVSSSSFCRPFGR